MLFYNKKDIAISNIKGKK